MRYPFIISRSILSFPGPPCSLIFRLFCNLCLDFRGYFGPPPTCIVEDHNVCCHLFCPHNTRCVCVLYTRILRTYVRGYTYLLYLRMWDGSPSLSDGRCGDTPRWVVWRNRTLGAGSATRIISECPRGARMAFKDYSDNEPVRSRGQGLLSTKAQKLQLICCNSK